MEAWAGIEPAIRVLQTLALPLGDQANITIYQSQLYLIKWESTPEILERETGLEPATSSLARKRSTAELLSQTK